MSRLAGALAVLVLIAGGLLLWLDAAGDRGGAPAAIGPEAGPTGAPGPGAPLRAAERAAVADGTVAAAGETGITRYRVVEAPTGEPIAGAELRRVTDGARVGSTGPDGEASATAPLGQLVFTAPGHLVAFFGLGDRDPQAVRQYEGEPESYEVRLWPDRFSIPWSLRFVSSAGAAPQWVRFRLQGEEQRAPTGAALPAERLGGEPPADPAVLAAWRRHQAVSKTPGFDDLALHFGADSAMRVFTAPAEVTARLVASGRYRLEALSSDGEVAQQQVRVTLRQRSPQVVQLERPREVAGQVAAAGGGAVEGATLRPLWPYLGVEPARSDAAGRFRLGPLPDVPVTLTVLHRDYEPHTAGPRRPAGAPWNIVLQPRPERVVRGRVRARPELRPVAGAEVEVRQLPGASAPVRTAEDGAFACSTTADDAELVIRAAGFLEYAEAIDTRRAPGTYDLLPATPADRVQAGLTALLAGRILGPGGEPASGMPVRVFPEAAPGFGGIPGRRILRGGVLALPHLAVAGDDGGFELECVVGGPARLVPADGVTGVEHGQWIDVTLGTVTRDLLLRARR